MELRVADNADEERYEVLADGELAGFVTYRRAPGRISLLHTEVDDAFEGHGIGGTLVRAALDDARARGLAVLPFCPFVRSYIKHHPEYLGLVPERERGRFEL
jgi:predicted GNAT family acetyltransferase